MPTETVVTVKKTVTTKVAVQQKPRPTKEELSRRGRSAKAKGKAWEKEVAEIIGNAIGMPSTDVFNSRSGVKECDVQLSLQARSRFPHYLECKNEKRPRVPAWVAQMTEDQKIARKRGKSSKLGIVVFKVHGNRTPFALVAFRDILPYIVKMPEKDNG